MKKLLLGFAACALLFTSCQKNDVMENISDGQGQLSFSMAMGKQTRAAELTNSMLIGDKGANKDNKMGIWAYQATGASEAWEHWFTDSLWYENSKWQIGSTRFRNASATKFYTLWPLTGAATKAMKTPDFAVTKPSFSYTIQPTQVDLVGGLTNVAANKTDITIKMRHLLSQVNFGTKGYEGAKISIGNIQVVGVNETATYTFLEAETEQTAAGRIGAWGASPSPSLKTYSYFLPGSSKLTDLSYATPTDASANDVNFIFGDGGNWGPGDVKYLNADNSAWQDKTTGTKLSNSLMLLPQSFVGAAAKVTFSYTITDIDGAYVAGTAKDAATGEFKLDFTSSNNTAYASEWKQNMRYVYIIDFTNFLDGNKLTFDVDVEAYEWENYNNGGDDDGIVDVKTVYQPTNTDMNTLATTDTFMVATRTKDTTTPTADVQLVDNQTWDWTQYVFNGIGAGETFDISFQKVVFNGKTITLTLPAGYTAALKAESAEENLAIDDINALYYVISVGDGSDKAAITITNNSVYSTTALESKITAITADATTIYYKGTAAVNLTAMDNTGLTTAGNTIVVKFTSLVTPTVGATTNGIWRYNSATKTATWTNVTWKTTLATTETAFGNATATATLYSGNTTAIAANNFATEPTSIANGGKVTILFNNTTVGTTLPTTTVYGTWVATANSPATGLTTYTYTRNDVLTLAAAKAVVTDITTNGRTIKCGDATNANITTGLGEPTNITNVTTVTVVFSAANTNRTIGNTTNGAWTTTDFITYTWTKN